MALKTQIDERATTLSIAETLVIPAASPYQNRLEEVPDADHGVEIRMVGPVTKAGAGSGTLTSGGIYSGLLDRDYLVEIDTAGDVGTATFKWSTDAGVTWTGTLIPIADTDPISLELGLTIQAVIGVGQDFNIGDQFTFSAEYWDEVDYVPTASGEFQVSYVTGDVDFHSADAGKTIQVSYEGRGSIVDAEDINQVIDVLNSGEVAIRNQDTSDFSARNCVGVDASGEYQLANATDGTKPALGFVKTVDDEEGEIVLFGPLAGFTGLTPNAVYYLNTTDGAIVTPAPSGAGNAVQKVGRALSTTVLLVRISDEISIV